MRAVIKDLASKSLTVILALITLGIVLSITAPPAFNAAGTFLLRRELSRDADSFYKALVEARAMALRTGHNIGVNMGSSGWSVHEDKGEFRLSGTWRNGTKLGSTIPSGQFFFEKDGTCRISQNAVCVNGNSDHPEREAHFVAITSNAQRIYTLFFDEAGKPLLEYDDY